MTRITKLLTASAFAAAGLTLTALPSAPAAADHHKEAKEGMKDKSKMKDKADKKSMKDKGDMKSMSADTSDMTVVEIAKENGSFNTLVAALEAADLVETLSGEGPFTVLAPTDAAFDALPEGTLDVLLQPENKQMLTDILTYHVVPAKAKAKDVTGMSEADTVNGAKLPISVEGDTVTLGSAPAQATVVKTDIMGKNGIIHVIDAVLLPPTDGM